MKKAKTIKKKAKEEMEYEKMPALKKKKKCK